MKKRGRAEPVPLRDVIPGVLRGVRGSGSGALGQVRAVWPEIVGPSVAARTRVAHCQDGRIRVEVASAALKHDLATFRAEEVLAEVRRRLPGLSIREINYAVGTPS